MVYDCGIIMRKTMVSTNPRFNGKKFLFEFKKG